MFMAPLASRGGPSTPTRVGFAGGVVVATAVAVIAVVVAGGVVVVVAVVVVEFVDRARPLVNMTSICLDRGIPQCSLPAHGDREAS